MRASQSPTNGVFSRPWVAQTPGSAPAGELLSIQGSRREEEARTLLLHRSIQDAARYVHVYSIHTGTYICTNTHAHTHTRIAQLVDKPIVKTTFSRAHPLHTLHIMHNAHNRVNTHARHYVTQTTQHAWTRCTLRELRCRHDTCHAHDRQHTSHASQCAALAQHAMLCYLVPCPATPRHGIYYTI